MKNPRASSLQLSTWMLFILIYKLPSASTNPISSLPILSNSYSSPSHYNFMPNTFGIFLWLCSFIYSIGNIRIMIIRINGVYKEQLSERETRLDTNLFNDYFALILFIVIIVCRHLVLHIFIKYMWFYYYLLLYFDSLNEVMIWYMVVANEPQRIFIFN